VTSYGELCATLGDVPQNANVRRGAVVGIDPCRINNSFPRKFAPFDSTVVRSYDFYYGLQERHWKLPFDLPRDRRPHTRIGHSDPPTAELQIYPGTKRASEIQRPFRAATSFGKFEIIPEILPMS